MFPKFLLKNGTGRIAALAKGQPAAIRVSPLLSDAAEKDADEVLRLLETSSSGLTQAEAEERLERHGPNEVAQEKQRGWLMRLLITMRNPLVILLSLLAVVTYRDRRPGGGVGHGADGDPGRGAAFRPGIAGRSGRRQAQGDDQRHGHGRPRRPAAAKSRCTNSCPAIWSSSRPAT